MKNTVAKHPPEYSGCDEGGKKGALFSPPYKHIAFQDLASCKASLAHVRL